MKYPQDFIEKAKKVYPNFPKLHEMIENGNEFAGRYLDDSCTGNIPAQHIMEMIEKGAIDELKVEAENEVARVQLYNEWRILSNS